MLQERIWSVAFRGSQRIKKLAMKKTLLSIMFLSMLLMVYYKVPNRSLHMAVSQDGHNMTR